ncbi:MAG TPA: class I SAM-dependent methyltransferase [Lentisphaeria bacterium]|nr:MAG: methyltransferase type 11 [Lentisphaerae bacterium GWF2_38_69]HBM17214.1 class I SAM-dependent methyltransferase [Lentisphaeria bacterium]
MKKSTINEIRERFDNDVERFSNLETGQISTVDAALSLELLTEAARNIKTDAKEMLDIGCGAGNYTLKMLSKLPDLNCTLLDLSKPMLDKAYERVSEAVNCEISIVQGDIRNTSLQNGFYDIILAGAVLHHLRDDSDWEFVFTKLYKALSNEGCLMIFDLITHDNEVINSFIWEKYAEYLEKSGGDSYKTKVLDYIEKEDSPRSLNYQTTLMKRIGFRSVEILHKNLCFAVFCAIK